MKFISLAVCAVLWLTAPELLTAQSAHGAPSLTNTKVKCPAGFWSIASSNSCYKPFTIDADLRHWEDRLKYCENVGPNGRLAFIDTKEKADDFVDLLTKIDDERVYEDESTPLVLGLKRDYQDVGSFFVWTDRKWKKNMTFSSWRSHRMSTPECCSDICVVGWFNYKWKKMEWGEVKCHKLTTSHRSLCEIIPNKWCPEGFISIPSSDSCYKVFSVGNKRSWEERLQFCKGVGPNGRLAYIDTQQKSADLATVMALHDDLKELESKTYSPMVIGLRRENYDCSLPFIWTDGISKGPMAFESFLGNQPDCNNNVEQCAIAWFDYGKKKTIWNDVTCDSFNKYQKVLCEITP